MKALAWSKLPNSKVKKSLWSEASAGGIVLDYKLFDHFFTDFSKTKEQQPAKAQTKSKSEDKATFLDPKRAQNIAIVASSIKTSSAAELAKALCEVELEKLTTDVVEKLLTLCPVSEAEVKQCREYTGDVDKLDRAERFLFELSKISGLEGRLRCVHFQQHFKEWQASCATSMAALSGAAAEVLGAEELRVVLAYLLAAGNYLNSGTLAAHRKNARGVKLNFLAELTKTTARGHPTFKKGNSFSFLHCVQVQLFANAPDADRWAESLPTLEQACGEDLSSVGMTLERIGEGAEALGKALTDIAAADKAAEGAEGGGALFIKRMAAFQEQMTQQVAALVLQKTELDGRMRALAEAFGEEPDNAPWVLRTLYTFAQQYSKVQVDNREMNKKAAAS